MLLSILPFAAGCAPSIKTYVAQGNLEKIAVLLPTSNYRTSSELAEDACVHNRPDVLKFLVEKGAALESTGKFASQFSSALHWCVYYDRVDMTRYLLSKGANISPAALAKSRGNATIRVLFEEEQARRANPGAPAPVASIPATAVPFRSDPSSDIDSPSRRGAERPDDFALVIGIEDYQSVPKADFGARDAKTVRKHLEALGFPPRNIVSLEGQQATGSKLRGYLEEWLPLNVKETSTLFVYYSGHGAPDTKTGDAYLVPWDGDPKFLKSTALPLKSLYANLAKTKAKRVIVALDACFSGAGGRSVLAQGARPLVAKVSELSAEEGRITVLAAASGDEITGTLQEQGHGLFTYHLLKGLSANPKASAKGLFDYLKPRVQDDARRDNREQTPVLAGSALSEPLLAP